MSAIWTDQNNQKFEIKQENGEWWHRKQGEGDDKWKKGIPPGFSQKAMNPLT